jgi:3-isopropylmalate dehydratase small subunit
MKSNADQLRIDIEMKMIEEKTQKQKKPEPIKDTSKQKLQSGS